MAPKKAATSTATKTSSKSAAGSAEKKTASTTTKPKVSSSEVGESEKKGEESNAGTLNSPIPAIAPLKSNEIGHGNVNITDYSSIPFEAGQIFAKFDYDRDGKLNKEEFTELVRNNPDLLRPLSIRPPILGPANGGLPLELVSHRVLTHFDETAGVAIARSEVEQHMRMGNIVTPLTDAYKARYERLRGVLTGKLLPKREHILQLRRQLQHTSSEVDARRRAIERETLTDTEQILERLRGVESMRQSSIRHQILQLEEELQSMERVVRRVERANIDDASSSGTSSILLTSAHPSSAPVEAFRTPKATAMVELIHEFSDLMSIIDKMAAKPVTVQVEYPTDDFPRETSERLEVLSRCDRYLHAVNVKDHMLWTALQEKEKLEQQLSEERKLSQEYALEVTKWAEMTQQLSYQVASGKQESEKLHFQVQELLHVLRSHNIYYEFER